jgi:hypothetical protein
MSSDSEYACHADTAHVAGTHMQAPTLVMRTYARVAHCTRHQATVVHVQLLEPLCTGIVCTICDCVR